MTGGQGTITGLISSLYLHFFNPEVRTQIILLESRCFYLLSHLASPANGPKCYFLRTRKNLKALQKQELIRTLSSSKKRKMFQDIANCQLPTPNFVDYADAEVTA